MVDQNRVQALDVQSTQFVATELPDIIDHFLCKICNYVVYQPKECPKCSSVFCFECNSGQISKMGKWKCPTCQSQDNLTDIHRVVKEVLEKLVFSCPKCKDVKRNYSEINKHLQSCDGQDQSMKDEVAIESFKRQESQKTVPTALTYNEIRIHIMEKDSKKFYIYNTRTQAVTLHTVNTGTNFPHNFQAI